jgi:molecular chaperone DnaK
MANDNKQLGNFNLEGIPPAPRGIPQIEVTFDIDANGIVNVSAKDKGTGKEQQITIQASGGLSEDEIKNMIKDAEANKEADKKKREEVDARNSADALADATEKSLKEHGDKVSAEDKAKIESSLTSLKDAIKDGNVETIKSKTKDLGEASMKLGEAIYKSQQEQAKPEPEEAKESTSGGDKENVVDADFEEVKEKDKKE